MKVLEKMKSMLMVFMCALTFMGLSSCSDDDDNVPQDDSQKATNYLFEFECRKLDGTDNASISNATLHFVDYQGKEVNKNIPLMSKTFTAKSQPYTKFPGELVVTLVESLKPNVTLDKETYDMGLDIKFTVTSFNAKGNIIDTKSSDTSMTSTMDKEELSNFYPETTTFRCKIDANGKISIH